MWRLWHRVRVATFPPNTHWLERFQLNCSLKGRGARGCPVRMSRSRWWRSLRFIPPLVDLAEETRVRRRCWICALGRKGKTPLGTRVPLWRHSRKPAATSESWRKLWVSTHERGPRLCLLTAPLPWLSFGLMRRVVRRPARSCSRLAAVWRTVCGRRAPAHRGVGTRCTFLFLPWGSLRWLHADLELTDRKLWTHSDDTVKWLIWNRRQAGFKHWLNVSRYIHSLTVFKYNSDSSLLAASSHPKHTHTHAYACACACDVMCICFWFYKDQFKFQIWLKKTAYYCKGGVRQSLLEKMKSWEIPMFVWSVPVIIY